MRMRRSRTHASHSSTGTSPSRLAITEYERVADLLEPGSPPTQWAAPTDCPGWDVRAMAGHMLGMVADGLLAAAT